MQEPLEQQIRDMFRVAQLSASGDEPEPPAGTVEDPTKVLFHESALRQEIHKAILMLAREIDALKRRLDA